MLGLTIVYIFNRYFLFTEQNINKSETGIGNQKLSMEQYVISFDITIIACTRHLASNLATFFRSSKYQSIKCLGISVRVLMFTNILHCVKSVQTRSFFQSAFSHIRTEYGEIRSISPYSVQMREKNSVFGHISHSVNDDDNNSNNSKDFIYSRTKWVQCNKQMKLLKKIVKTIFIRIYYENLLNPPTSICHQFLYVYV